MSSAVVRRRLHQLAVLICQQALLTTPVVELNADHYLHLGSNRQLCILRVCMMTRQCHRKPVDAADDMGTAMMLLRMPAPTGAELMMLGLVPCG